MAREERSDAGSPLIGGEAGSPSSKRTQQVRRFPSSHAAPLEVTLSITDTPARSAIPAVPVPVRRGRLAAAGLDRRAARDAEDRELIRRCQQDPSPHVRAQTVEAFMPLARSLARRYHRGEEPLEDLCLLYTSPSPRDLSTSRMPSSA